MPIGRNRLLGEFIARFDPHRLPTRKSCPAARRHTGRERVGAQQERVYVVVADNACRAPRRELASRQDFGDARRDPLAAAERQQLERRADAQIAELVLAQVEAPPEPRVSVERHDCWPGIMASPGSATSNATVPSAGARTRNLTARAAITPTAASALFTWHRDGELLAG